MRKRMRKHLSASGLLESLRLSFSSIKDPLGANAKNYSLVDCLMSGLAVFGMKSPSLLDFDEKRKDEPVCENLQNLYGVKQAPCDTQLRKRLDPIKPQGLQRAYKSGFRAAQRGKALQRFEFLKGYYLLSNDGTGIFHSEKVHCDNCCVKHHRDGRVSYYHQMMSCVMVHPDEKVVLPMLSEPITKPDGNSKNDCERNASKRLLTQLRKMHPQLKMVIVEDALHSNGPHIQLLRSLDYQYIIGVKPADHAWLFDWVKASQRQALVLQRGDKQHRYEWVNDVPLNERHEGTRVNFIEYWETNRKTGKTIHFTWVTSFHVTCNTVFQLVKGARARWKVENETFNTLKNQGYHFEHNFGHGYDQLSTVFAHLMMLAFLVDQLQQLCCPVFQKALAVCLNKKKNLWERMRHFFMNCIIVSWEAFFHAIIHKPRIVIDTS